MDEKQREQIALFRFAVINPLVSQRHLSRGQKETLITEITERQWKIPGSSRSSIARSTVQGWLSDYLKSGQNIESLKPKKRRDAGSSRSIDSETEAIVTIGNHEIQSDPLRDLITFSDYVIEKPRHILI